MPSPAPSFEYVSHHSVFCQLQPFEARTVCSLVGMSWIGSSTTVPEQFQVRSLFKASLQEYCDVQVILNSHRALGPAHSSYGTVCMQRCLSMMHAVQSKAGIDARTPTPTGSAAAYVILSVPKHKMMK